MAEASRIVLDGFEVGTDVKVVRWPDRCVDLRGEIMWQRVMDLFWPHPGSVRNRTADERTDLPVRSKLDLGQQPVRIATPGRFSLNYRYRVYYHGPNQDSGRSDGRPFVRSHIRSVPVDTPTIRRLREVKEQRKQERFVAGQFHFGWLSRAARAHPRGLEMVLLVKRAVDLTGRQPVTVPEEMCAEFGMTRQTRYRALQALEAADLVRWSDIIEGSRGFGCWRNQTGVCSGAAWPNGFTRAGAAPGGFRAWKRTRSACKGRRSAPCDGAKPLWRDAEPA